MLAKLARKKRDYWIKLSFVGLGVLGHQLLVLLPQGVHPINHLLHKLDLTKKRMLHKITRIQGLQSHLRVPEPVFV